LKFNTIKPSMKSLCVYCASSPGKDPVYIQSAQNMGKILAEHGIRLIYGGGGVGLMGALADSVMENGGEVTGVLPKFLDDREVGHNGITEMILVNSLHDRKLKLSEISDGFVAMPGGFGTLEELAEILTWAQLGLIQKPIGILNVNNYFRYLVAMFDTMVEERLLKVENRDMLLVADDPETLLDRMTEYKFHPVEKWLDRGNV